MSLPLRALVRSLLLAAFALLADTGAAHLTPNSEIRLTVGERNVTAGIIVPQGEYAYATGNPVGNDAQSRRIAADYLRSHFTVTGPDGRRWTVALQRVEFARIAGPPDLHAVALFTPPAGASPRDFAIDWHVVVDRLPGHFALFVLEDPGQPGANTILGAVRTGSPPLRVNVSEESALGALGSAIALGAHHILGGYDHLMFLLALLLPAPLFARGGRWSGHRPTRDTLAKLGWIVTAFTLGHSLTLVGATLGRWSLPTAPVEVAIAISVLVSAIHALRPLLPGREPLIALFFGLIHGLAFATLIQQAHAGRMSGAIGLFGFNLGIELVQLAIVAAVVPSLIVLSRDATYRWVRPGFAVVCAGAALAWIVNRATGQGDAFVSAMEAAMARSGWLVPALAVLALATAWRRNAADAEPN